jgi:hypothetical protein
MSIHFCHKRPAILTKPTINLEIRRVEICGNVISTVVETHSLLIVKANVLFSDRLFLKVPTNIVRV